MSKKTKLKPKFCPLPSAPDDEAKEKLILAAIPLFAEHGFEGTKVRDIVKNAGVNLCLISYYFSGKERLYRECIERFAQARSEVAFRMLEPATTSEEFKIKFKMAVNEMFVGLSANKDIMKILSRELENEKQIRSRDLFDKYFVPMFGAFTNFFADAQKRGFIREDVSPESLSEMVHGSVKIACQWDHLRTHYAKLQSIGTKEERERSTEQITKVILDGVLKGRNI